MAFRIAVIGTSISWGQGLNRDETFAARVQSAIGRLRDEHVILESYAHSGAKLWRGDPAQRPLKNDAPKDFDDCLARVRKMKPAPQWPGSASWREWVGECPDGEPYLWLQALEAAHDFADPGAEADLVLVDAGANDVDFMKSIRPDADYRTPTRNLSGAIAPLLVALHEHRAFKHAAILVSGYYRAFSSASRAANAPKGATLGWFFQGLKKPIDDVMLPVLAARCDDWVTRMHNVIQADVSTANSAANAPFCFFVDPAVPPEGAMFASHEMIWSPDAGGSPRDHATQRRLGPKAAAGSARRARRTCSCASAPRSAIRTRMALPNTRRRCSRSAPSSASCGLRRRASRRPPRRQSRGGGERRSRFDGNISRRCGAPVSL